VKTKPYRDLADRIKADPERVAEIEAEKRAIARVLELAELRARRGTTQRELARTLGVSQANVSRVEHEDDVYLSSLSAYVAALGGRLEIRAVFPDEEITLLSPDG
jgi:DNA-binding XRE family transcriptional regulator